MEQSIEIQTKLYERDNDIAELKAAVAFLADKANAAIITNEPSRKVIFDWKRIATGIKIPSANNNMATAQIAKIMEENQESATMTGTQSKSKTKESKWNRIEKAGIKWP
jgi:hypothetical protein